MLGTLCLFAWLAAAVATDVSRHKIYNATTYSGILVALTLGALAAATDSDWLTDTRFGSSALGLAVCGLVMVVCFALFRVGGGDVKLLAMLGAFLGPERGIEALLWTFVIGAAWALGILVWRLGWWTLARRVVQQVLWRLRCGGWNELTDDERRQLQMRLFLAPSALAAAVVVQLQLGDRWL